MKAKTFKYWRIAIGIVIGGLVAWGAVSGNVWVPVGAVVGGIILVLAIGQRATDIMTDERTYSIAEKAARLAFGLFSVLGAVTGLTLIAVGRDRYPELETAGLTLAYSVCALLIFNLVAYYVYNRKLGGERD